MVDEKNNVYIIQGNDGEVENFFKGMQIIWNVKGLKIQKIKYKECDILSDLTPDQKKILNFAKDLGYYDYPRKITHEELSKKIGIDKDLTLENLRKAEKQIISRILSKE